MLLPELGVGEGGHFFSHSRPAGLKNSALILSLSVCGGAIVVDCSLALVVFVRNRAGSRRQGPLQTESKLISTTSHPALSHYDTCLSLHLDVAVWTLNWCSVIS